MWVHVWRPLGVIVLEELLVSIRLAVYCLRLSLSILDTRLHSFSYYIFEQNALYALIHFVADIVQE